MTNLRIVNENSAEIATLTATSTAGDLVVTNMQTDLKSEIWRSTSTVETIIARFSTAQFVSVVSFPFCNFTSSATMRVRLFTNDADTIPIYDSGIVNCSPYETLGDIKWGSSTFGVNSFSYGGSIYARVWTEDFPVEKVVIDIDDHTNSSGYIEAGVCVIGSYWSPILNASYGASSTVVDTSSTFRNDAGDSISNRGTIHKVLSMNLEYMKTGDRNNLMQMMRGNGTSNPFFLSLYPENEDSILEQDGQIYGKLQNTGTLSNIFYQNFSSDINIEES